MTTETIDKLYLEWSQFTQARTSRELEMAKALAEIAGSKPSRFEDPVEHANWCIERASALVGTLGERR